MSFPKVNSLITHNASATTHNFNIPAIVYPGDLLIALPRAASGQVFNSFPTGAGWIFWTGGNQHPVYYKIADGSESGGVVTFGSSGAFVSAGEVLRVTNWYGDFANGAAIGADTATSAAPTFPALNPPAWDIENTLWISALVWAANTDVTWPPAGYTSLGKSAAGTNPRVAAAYKNAAVASEDPANQTLGASTEWAGRTIAIRPAVQPSFEFKWSIENLEARLDYDMPTMYAELSSVAMPSGPFPEGKFFEKRILMPMPQLSEVNIDPDGGITGFQSLTITFDNANGALSNIDFYDTYIRVFFIDGGGAFREFKGIATQFDIGIKTTVVYEEIEIKALAELLPKKTLNNVDFTHSTLPANDLGNPLAFGFGRVSRMRTLYARADEAGRLYDYIIGHGIGLGGAFANNVTTAYRGDFALDEINGTAAAGTASTLTLETADRRGEHWYEFFWIEIVSGTGSGQIRFVTAYDSANNRVTVNTNFSPTPNATSVYRLREWRFYNGGAGSPFPGYASIQFKKRMGSQSSVDPIYVDADLLQTERNVVRAIQSVLSNTDWGLGLTVDTSSFNTAAALSSITAMLCEGLHFNQTIAFDLIRELMKFRGITLARGDAGITISVDTAKASSFQLRQQHNSNILDAEPLIRKKSSSQITRNLKARYRRNYKASGEDLYLCELQRPSNDVGIDAVVDYMFVYDHVTADRRLDYDRKIRFFRIPSLVVNVGEELKTAKRGDMGEAYIEPLGQQGNKWEVLGSRVTLAGVHELTLAPYSDEIYIYEAFSALPADTSFAITPFYDVTGPDPVSNVVISMSREVLGYTVFPFALFTFDPPEDNYSTTIVKVKKLAEAFALYREVTRVERNGRIEGLTPGQLYTFLYIPLNVNGSVQGTAVEMTNGGAGYLAGGDSTAPAFPGAGWTPNLIAEPGLGSIRWTWARHPDPDGDVSYYEIEIYSALSGGTLLKKDTIKHINGDTTFSPGYEYLRQPNALTGQLVAAARIRAKDNTGNPTNATLGWTARVAGTTRDILQGDIEPGEVINKNESNAPSVPSWVSGQTLISASITKRAGTSIRIEFSGNYVVPAVSTNLTLRLSRGASSIQNPFCSAAAHAAGTVGLAGVYDEDGLGAGTFTYNIISNFTSLGITGSNFNLRLVEYRNPP